MAKVVYPVLILFTTYLPPEEFEKYAKERARVQGIEPNTEVAEVMKDGLVKVAQPRTVIQLWKADIKEVNFNRSDPTLLIIDKSSGACIPCGHVVGCINCLNDIKAKNRGCPVRCAQINQVVKLYTV